MFAKRIFDVVISCLGLIILIPLFIIIAILIKLTSTGPVFFCQDRVGKDGNIFKIIKFRTMIQAHGAQITIGKDYRITPIGHLLRKFKVDELPQLINVFLGEMSLVGPRPEVPKYVAMYPESIRRVVLSVRPGITDWASLSMINESDVLAKSSDPEAEYINVIMPKKLEFAVKYVNSRTFCQDCAILVATLKKYVIFKPGWDSGQILRSILP